MTRAQSIRAVIALCAMALLTFLFFKARSIDFERHNRILETLRQLKQLDGQVNQDVIQSRYALLKNNDSLVLGFWNINRLGNELRQGSHAIYQQGDAQLDAILDEATRLHAQKESLAEQFKSANAILKNSANYFPLLAQQIATTPHTRSGNQLGYKINELARELLGYNANPTEAVRQDIATKSNEISALRANYAGDQAAQIGQLLKHLQMLLDKTPEVDGLLTQVVTLPTDQQWDSLQRAYLATYHNAQKTINLYRVVLNVGIVLLLLTVAYILIKLKLSTVKLERAVTLLEQQKQALDESKRQLNTLNQELELRVQHRTAALEEIGRAHV